MYCTINRSYRPGNQKTGFHPIRHGIGYQYDAFRGLYRLRDFEWPDAIGEVGDSINGILNILVSSSGIGFARMLSLWFIHNA